MLGHGGRALVSRLCLSLLVGLPFVQPALAQTHTFDIATFVPPKGWSQTQSPGVLIVQDRRVNQGRAEFCQIYLFASQLSPESPAVNFQNEWAAKVARPLGLTGRPSPQAETHPDGWTSVTDHADVTSQGVPLRVILFTVTGFGRFASVVVSVSPNAYQAELIGFFRDLSFRTQPGGQSPLAQPARPANPEAPGAPGPTADSPDGGSLASYIYTAPDGWGRQAVAGRIVLTSPVFANGERCQLTMLPMRALARPLGEEAIGTFRDLFRTDPLTTYPSPPPKLRRGTSPFGWDFFTIKKLVGGQEGEARTMGTILLAAKVGGQLAVIVGTSKDFMVSQCFGLLQSDVWPKFFYSLDFKNVGLARLEAATLRQRLAGTWIMATGRMGLRYEFRTDGRYADAAATQYTTAISGNRALQTTQAFFGNGSYSLDGNTMVMTRDDHQRSTFFFRIEQASDDSGRTWVDELCLLTPGSSGEVCYRKE